MMGIVIKWVLGKVPGPILFYVILGLSIALAAETALLKRAWTKNVQAVLKCENDELRDANARHAAVLERLTEANKERDELRQARNTAAVAAEHRAEIRIAEQEARHEAQLEAMEVAANDISDEEYFCASDPVNAGQLNGMRESARAYNQSRNSRRTAEGSLSPDT